MLALAACGSSNSAATATKPSPGIRVNKLHVSIHQDTQINTPIITVATENGDPNSKHFRNDMRVLELAILGDLEHPAACGIVIEHFTLSTPYSGPMDDLLIGDNKGGSIEKRGTIACSEKTDSTRLNWPDNSVNMTGHLSYTRVGDENSDDYEWEYHIDHIQEAPRITAFDPPDSFTWQTAKPIVATLPRPGDTAKYSATSFQVYIPLRPQRQTYACSNGTTHTMTLERYDSSSAYRITYRWIGTAKPITPTSDLQGHDAGDNLFYDGDFDAAGKLRKFARPQMAVPLTPHAGFISKILYENRGIYPRSWVGSTTADVNFTDAAGNGRNDHLRVQVFKDAFPEGDLLSAYADGVGLIAVDYYQGSAILVDCKLTRIDSLTRSGTP